MGSNRLEVFTTALRLGLTSFGGPFAHLGYFHQEYVVQRKWLDEEAYADLVALCQLLPGPTSSQVGIAVGRVRAGGAGAFLAWAGFTLPSALLMVLFAVVWKAWSWDDRGLVRGLELGAFAVVAQAAWGMGLKLANGKRKFALALAAAAGLAWFPSPVTQPLVLVVAGLVSLLLFRESQTAVPLPVTRSRKVLWLGVFAVLLVVLPGLAALTGAPLVGLADSFYRTGSLVFGGGHVVVPLLQTELVAGGRMPLEDFLAGYGFVQILPGPLFTVSAFFGWMIEGPAGALVALGFLFLPSFLLLAGILPFWDQLKASARVRRALVGVNAAVVGFLAWTLYNPIGVQALRHPVDFVLAAALTAGLMLGKAPVWAVVPAGVAAALGLQALGL